MRLTEGGGRDDVTFSRTFVGGHLGLGERGVQFYNVHTTSKCYHKASLLARMSVLKINVEWIAFLNRNRYIHVMNCHIKYRLTELNKTSENCQHYEMF